MLLTLEGTRKNVFPISILAAIVIIQISSICINKIFISRCKVKFREIQSSFITKTVRVSIS